MGLKLPSKYTPVPKKRVFAKIMTDTESLEAQLLKKDRMLLERDRMLAEKDEEKDEMLLERDRMLAEKDEKIKELQQELEPSLLA